MRDIAEIRCRIGIAKTYREVSDGLFSIFKKKSTLFQTICSFGVEWEHVSVTLPCEQRCPTWDEMSLIKRIFFKDEETVVQYHPASQDYVNIHQYCLHLWRPQRLPMPKPPLIMV